ncbi:hypothetical protein E4U60_004480 [Claviceps pazoutovae]|uniref:Uncharacterized protein n=1 Tax=Claviceps pazoutovae TaxID=1649127 RepID=A0A9P7SJZ1_9HYPO|nr:hypothetical protein E4U60_004480 [Claviceps pazoutovae]
MKFNAFLGSLAIYGIQVHAIPTDLDSQAIQPIEANSPISNTLEARDTYCCVGLRSSVREITKFIPRGPVIFQWYISTAMNQNTEDSCLVYVKRNPNNCDGWKFKTVRCDGLGSYIDVTIRPADDCRN